MTQDNDSNLDVRGKPITPYTSIQLYPELRSIIRDRDITRKGIAAEEFMLDFMSTLIPDMTSCRDEPYAMDLYSPAFGIRVEVKNILSTNSDIKSDCINQFNRDCLVHKDDTRLFVFINVAYDDLFQTHIEDNPLRMFINGHDMNEHMLNVIAQTAFHADKWSYTCDKIPSIRLGNPKPGDPGVIDLKSPTPPLTPSQISSQRPALTSVSTQTLTPKRTLATQTIESSTPKLKLSSPSKSDVTISPYRYVRPDSYECKRMQALLHDAGVKRIPKLEIKHKVQKITLRPPLRRVVDDGIVINKRCTERPIKYKLGYDKARSLYHYDDANDPIILCDTRGNAYEVLTADLIDRMHEEIHKNDKPKGIFDTVTSWFGEAHIPILYPF